MLFRFNQLAVVQGSLFAALAAPVADPFESLVEYLTAQQIEEDAENVDEGAQGPAELAVLEDGGVQERQEGPPTKDPKSPSCKKEKGKNEPDGCPGPR